MTDTMTDVTNPRKAAPGSVADQLIAQARAEGVSLVGPGSPLAALTKQVLETALEAELDEHLGYEHGDRDGKTSAVSGNTRNGTRAKTVHTELGPVSIEVPRDRDGSFEPLVVRKRQRRLSGVDAMVLSLSAKGLCDPPAAEHVQVRRPSELGRHRPRHQARLHRRTAAAAAARFDEFAERWGCKYPAAIGLWRAAWTEFIPFLDYDVEIRRVICTTNAIESLNARFRRAVRARGHFPTDQAALKCLYLVARSLDPTGTAKTRWMNRWKPALNAFAITFPGRLDTAGTNQ